MHRLQSASLVVKTCNKTVMKSIIISGGHCFETIRMPKREIRKCHCPYRNFSHSNAIQYDE